jgi:putative membrane protein
MDAFDKMVCRVGIGLMVVGLFLAVAVTESGSRVSTEKGLATETYSNASANDRQFLRKAVDDDLAEVEMSRLAQHKASSQQVKGFAQTLVDDHSKTKDQLEKIASNKHIDIPKGLSAKNQATKDWLAKFSGEQFDNAYMAEMVKDHQQDVATFRYEVNSAQDVDIREFADKSLPTLESRLKQAENITPELKTERSALRKPSPAIRRSGQEVRYR